MQELTAKVVAVEAEEARSQEESEEKLKAANDRQTQAKSECDERIKGIKARCNDQSSLTSLHVSSNMLYHSCPPIVDHLRYQVQFFLLLKSQIHKQPRAQPF